MIIFALKTWLRAQRNLWRDSHLSRQMHTRWPGLDAKEPISWNIDDPNAINFGSPVFIGPFSEIVVTKKGGQSNIVGRLHIGSRTCIGAGSNIRAAGGPITIGDDCLIAQHVSLVASNHTIETGRIYHELAWDDKRFGISIGNNVWIGAGVTVLPGCTIGDNSVVGAGSVVTKSIPDGTVWAGVPARQIRIIS